MRAPTYTQNSVAFPNVPLGDSTTDDVNVSFGGTQGEFSFEWLELSGFPRPCLRFKVFMDGLGGFLDARTLSVLEKLNRKRDRNRDVRPEELIAMLDEAGFEPSHYHLRGLIEAGAYSSMADRAELQRRYETAKQEDV
jgi:hypothetical protein